MIRTLKKQDLADLEIKGYCYLRKLLAADEVAVLKEQVAKALDSALEGEGIAQPDGARTDGRKLTGREKFRKLGRIDRLPEVWKNLVLQPREHERQEPLGHGIDLLG